MTADEFFKWMASCPSNDWEVMDATLGVVYMKFPLKAEKSIDKSNLRVIEDHGTQDWITDEELKEANKKALAIFDEFYDNIGDGEETWTEIQVGDKFFDVNCWDEGIGYDLPSREGAVHCSIYKLVEEDGGYRYCEGDKYLRLFTVDKTLGEE
jgi:hypothetical protein